MKKKESILKKPAVQSLIASLLCIVLGLLIGYIVLLFINPEGAGGAIRYEGASSTIEFHFGASGSVSNIYIRMK